MTASLDLSRWRERPRGLGYRRWVIASTGLRRLAQGRLFRTLFALSWIGSAVLALTAFVLAQAASEGGSLDEFLGHFGPRGAALASALRALVLLYPDVCVHTFFTFLFWLQSYLGLGLSLVALTLVVPELVARDRASRALTLYLSRPLTTFDYLLGKLGVVAGVLALLWTGPLLFTWLVGVLFASDRDFLIYSFSPLLRALAYNGIGLIALAAIALGVSALARSARATTAAWLGLWLVAAFVARVPHMPAWIQCASFSRDLGRLRSEAFRFDQALVEAGQTLPLASAGMSESLTRMGNRLEPTDVGGAIAGLAVLTGASALVFFRRLRPE